MNKNRNIIRGLAAGLAVGMSVATCPAPVFAAEETTAREISKDETVYVNADASGNRQHVTVSNWLKNAGTAKSVIDRTSLDNIKNIKGDETFQEDGDVLTWETDGSDIYYQGTTDEELPVSVKFTYYLDGKEITPEELKGKSGHVTIRMDYTNDAAKEVNVDGEKETLYSPFVMVTTMVLPNETFSNVVIDNGKVINDGSRNIVVGFAVPGLKESLGLDREEDKLVLPDYLEVSADVSEFSLSSTYTAAIPDVLEDMNIEDASDYESIQNALDEMEDAALALVAGSDELADGAAELEEGTARYTQGVDSLRDAVQTYMGENGELTGKVKEYVNGVDTLTAGIQDYVEGADELASGITAYVAGEQKVAEGAAQFSELKTGMTQVQEAVHLLSQAVDGEGTTEEDIRAAADALASGTGKLEEVFGSEAVQNMLGQMNAMIKTGGELIEDADALGSSFQESVGTPVQDMVTQLVSLSVELKKVEEVGQKLNSACDRINEVIRRDNAKIETAKTAGQNSRTEIQQSIDSLTQQKNQLQDTQPEAAEKLEDAIRVLENAKGAAEQLTALESLEEVQGPDLSAVDRESLENSVTAVQEDMTLLAKAAGDMTAQLSGLQEKMDTIREAQEQFPTLDEMEQLTGQIAALDQGMQALDQAIGGEGGLAESLETLDRSVSSSFPKAISGLDAMNSGLTQLSSFNETLLNGAAQLQAAGPDFCNGAVTLAEGTGQLTAGLNQLSGQLAQGTNELASNSGTLREGAAALRDGAFTLRDGMARFEREGTGKMKQTVEDELGEVLQRLETLVSGECSYDTFSGKDSAMNGTVKFIIETEEI